MKQDIYEEFLNLYKKIETAIPKMKDAPLDANVRWFEESIVDMEKRNKLYLCRIIRNYIQHNADFKTFIHISSEMIDFLSNIYIEVLQHQLKNKDIMIHGNQLIIRNINDNIIDTIKKMETKKQDFVPIIENNKLLGIFSDKIIRQILIKNKSTEKTFDQIRIFLKIPGDVKFVKTEDTIEKTLELIKKDCKCVICTNNGRSTGTVDGIIRKEELTKIGGRNSLN